MASRALGAFLALAAAAAIVVSIASSAWWAGTPVIDGKAFDAKDVHAGPLGATGCNVGGDGSCEPVAIDQTVQMIGYAELGAAALATLFLFVLLSAALRVSEHRRGIATTSLLFTLLAGGGAGALLALGPGIQASQVVEVPIGWGAYAFGGGIFASLLASLITRRLEPEPLRLKPTLSPIDPHTPTACNAGSWQRQHVAGARDARRGDARSAVAGWSAADGTEHARANRDARCRSRRAHRDPAAARCQLAARHTVARRRTGQPVRPHGPAERSSTNGQRGSCAG